MITPFQVGSSARSIKEPLHGVEVWRSVASAKMAGAA
jgi:hypothetical protein